jgi:SAM-dependent methyltransferase
MPLKLISPMDASPLEERDGVLADRSGNVFKKKNNVWEIIPQMPVSVQFTHSFISQEYFRKYPFDKSIKATYPENCRSAWGIKENNIAGLMKKQDGQGKYCLDHGCGSGSLKGVVESLGYQYIGIDNEIGSSSEHLGGNTFAGGANYYCDLHFLPFEKDSFDFAISYSVFEHLQNPFIAARELHRVLKPGGEAFVAIASLIPFHMDSFMHHTHFGVLNLFKSTGFEVCQVAGANWNAYQAISQMDGLPGPRWIRESLSKMLVMSQTVLWKIRRIKQKRNAAMDELLRHNMMAGIIKAHLRKPLS